MKESLTVERYLHKKWTPQNEYRLTKKQKQVLEFIKQFYAENKYPPSIRQICSAINLSSPATVHVHINHLVEKGFIKRTSINEFTVTNRGTKGSKIHILNDEDDRLICFAPLVNEKETIIVSSKSQIKINLNEVNLLSKGAQGTKSIKLTNSKVIGLLTF